MTPTRGNGKVTARRVAPRKSIPQITVALLRAMKTCAYGRNEFVRVFGRAAAVPVTAANVRLAQMKGLNLCFFSDEFGEVINCPCDRDFSPVRYARQLRTALLSRQAKRGAK
jgi:hypothetical protein